MTTTRGLRSKRVHTRNGLHSIPLPSPVSNLVSPSDMTGQLSTDGLPPLGQVGTRRVVHNGKCQTIVYKWFLRAAVVAVPVELSWQTPTRRSRGVARELRNTRVPQS